MFQIITLKSRLTHQEGNAQQQHNLRRQLEEMFEKEKNILKAHSEEDKKIIKQLELRIDVNRRTIQELREERASFTSDYQQVCLTIMTL